MLGVGVAGSDEHVAAPILPLLMEEPFVKAHPSREWPATHYAQVKIENGMLINISVLRKFPQIIGEHRE